MRIKKTAIILTTLTLCSALQAEWHYALGTGIGMTEKDGDIGFNTVTQGAQEFDVDLDPDDMNDVMQSAFGLSGMATNGTWSIAASFSNLELGDKQYSSVFDTGIEWDFDEMIAELTVGYTVYRSEKVVVQAYTGVRYVDHDIELKLRDNDQAGSDTGDSVSEQPIYEESEDTDIIFTDIILDTTKITINEDGYKLESDWTDVIIGLAANVVITDGWTWTNKVDAGFGGSEGSYTAKSGITWKFHENWSTSLVAGYYAAEFEEGSKGDDDWYLYDVDTTSLSLGFLYHF